MQNQLNQDDAYRVEIPKTEALPFSERRQEAILGYLLDDPDFFKQARHKMKPEWFYDINLSRVWEAQVQFYERFGRTPLSTEELTSSQRFYVEEPPVRNRMSAAIVRCRMAKTEFGLEPLRAELTTWLKTRIFKAYHEKSAAIYSEARGDDSKFQTAFEIFRKGGQEIQAASFEGDNAVSFADIANGVFFESRSKELEDALTFGCPLLDRKLNKDCVRDASLLRGDMTVLLAPTNVGKTTTMVSVIRHNIAKGRSILFITHEGRPEDIKAKIIQAALSLSFKKLMDISLTEQGQKALSGAAAILSKNLVYLPMNKPGLTVEDVEARIRLAQEKRIAETGKGFDMIVDDYPAKLTTVMASRGHWQRRAIDEHVYNFFTQIALEFHAHVLVAIQTNREGSKVNKGRSSGEDRLVTMEDVSESWGAMTTATNVISLNRDEIAQAKQRMTFHICKSRSNETGWSIVTRTSFAESLTHAPLFASTFYRGNGSLAVQMDELFESGAFNGKSIPEHYYA